VDAVAEEASEAGAGRREEAAQDQADDVIPLLGVGGWWEGDEWFGGGKERRGVGTRMEGEKAGSEDGEDGEAARQRNAARQAASSAAHVFRHLLGRRLDGLGTRCAVSHCCK
jgi:hypothetical protein